MAKETKKSVPITSADHFVLKDTTGDGIPDEVVIEKAPKPDPNDLSKFNAYFQHLTDAKNQAERENAGRSAIEIAAAVNVAVAEAKKSWKGPKPPESMTFDAAKAKAEKEAADKKAAIEAEVRRLANK